MWGFKLMGLKASTVGDCGVNVGGAQVGGLGRPK